MSLPVLPLWWSSHHPELPARADAGELRAALQAAPPAQRRPVEIDLWRPYERAPRIYVRAGLPDGTDGVFLVDTGADISVLSVQVAERLGLSEGDRARVSGLSGAADVRMTELPTLDLGGQVVRRVQVAVGVPGLQDRTGFVPVDGLLGNNVWSQFTLELDYPADLMVLHPAGTGPGRGRSEPLFFDGGHLSALIEVTTDEAEPKTLPIVAQVDTGAGELTLCAGTGLPLAGETTEGLESVRGIGASETLPPYRFLRMTRRIPLSSVTLGGATVEVPLPARWVDFDAVGRTTCDEGPGAWRALIGHEFLASHRVVFDYEGRRWALLPSRRPERAINAHQILLDEELSAHGEDPARGLDRSRWLVGVGRDGDAVDALTAWRGVGDPDPERLAEGTVLLAQLLRHQGHHGEAFEALSGMSPGDLVDQDQIVGTVNGLVFEGRAAEARALAEAAIAERPDDGWARVALADVELSDGRLDAARDTLLEAAALEGYPDAHLLRRARVALATGDRVGSMALVRRLLSLYPADGPYLWFYAMLVEDDADRARFATDLQAAMARLHPFSLPFDFLVAAHHALGDEASVDTWLERGLAAHCEPMPPGPASDNCRAWYGALAGRKLDDALIRIDRALAATGPRADFLDTAAMVHLARGESDAALTSAREAARLSPDDVYMLWQAERIADLATERRPAGGAP